MSGNENVIPEEFKTYSNLYLMMTHDCNFACEYCFNCGDKSSYLSFEDAEKAIDIYVAHSNSPNLGLVFFGGEPTLAIELIKKIKDYCKTEYPAKTWSFNITTNLAFINSLVDEEVLMDPAMHVLISLDGPEEVNSPRIWKSNKSKTFSVVYENLKKVFSDPKYAEKIKTQQIGIRATLAKENISSLFEIVYFLHTNFKTNWVLNNVDEDNWDEIPYSIFSEQFAKVLRYAESLGGPQGAAVLGNIKFFKDIGQAFKIHAFNLPNTQDKSCGQCMGQFAVDYTGRFSPCHRFTNTALKGCNDYVVGDVNSGLDYPAIARIRALDSLTENKCAEKECKKIGTCAFNCFASGVEINQFKPRCNGDVLKNLFDMSYQFISEVFASSEDLPAFYRFLDITPTRKAFYLIEKLREENRDLRNTIEKILIILEKSQNVNQEN